MTVGTYLLSSFFGGAVGGAIGAAVSQDADHPVIKGAVINGLISAGVGLLLMPVAISAPKQVGTAGHLPSLRGFP